MGPFGSSGTRLPRCAPCLAGASLFRSWTGLALTGVLAVLWGAKARVEEGFLSARFPDYEKYRRRVRHRLVPFVY